MQTQGFRDGAGDVPKGEPYQGAAVWVYGGCKALIYKGYGLKGLLKYQF